MQNAYRPRTGPPGLRSATVTAKAPCAGAFGTAGPESTKAQQPASIANAATPRLWVRSISVLPFGRSNRLVLTDPALAAQTLIRGTVHPRRPDQCGVALLGSRRR